MEIVVSAHPHILLETLELLYAYVNNVSPEFLTYPGAYCIPVYAVQDIMSKACKDVPTNSSALQYYFSKRVFYEDPEQTTCIARNLCYNNSAISTEGIDVTGGVASYANGTSSSSSNPLCRGPVKNLISQEIP